MTDTSYTSANTPVGLRTKTVDISGKPIAVRNIERVVNKVEWETFKRQEVDGGFYYRSEKKYTEVARETISTDSSGNWSGSITLPATGEYEVMFRAKDDRGHLVTTKTGLYIYGDNVVSMPENNNYELEFEVTKPSLQVGEEGSLLIKSPYKSAKALIAVERGTIYEYSIVTITGGLYLHTFPIKSEYAPNIYVSVLLLSPDPEVKYGMTRFEVGAQEKELVVEVSAHKTHYLPGEEVKLSVRTKDHTGKAVPAEVSIAVADLSVLALKGNPKKDPLVFFYDGFPLSVSTASNIKNVLHEVDVPLGTKGGGGGEPDDLASKKRGLFKDTAFWQASVVTDQNGEAAVTFTLPDNLTTWQIESLGITKDTKLGVDYKEFTTQKDLMAVPLKPRFVVPGDRFSLGASVFNQTDADAKVEVALASDSLTFTGEQSDTISIPKGESRTVYFEVEAPRIRKAGTHQFTFTAQSGDLIDSVEQVIPITANTTYETVATANFTDTDLASEYVYIPKEVLGDEGGLTINANATLAVFLNDALSYMVTYPYGCSEQLASALSTIAVVTRGLDLPNVEGGLETLDFEGVTYTIDQVVEQGLEKMYQAQTFAGGFSYYKGLKPSLTLTIHVVRALNDLKQSGFPVREDVIARGAAYIESEALTVYTNNPGSMRETVVLAEFTLRRLAPEERTRLTEIVEGFIGDEAYLNERIGSNALAHLAILTATGYGRQDRNRVYDALTNRIDIDGRGAYLKGMGRDSYGDFETPVANTALLLSAFAAHEDEHVMMGNVLRWLLASRDTHGAWGGTHNTFGVVSAMIEYLAWQRETESHFTLRGLLDTVEIFVHEFSPSNIFETFTHTVGINELPREKLVPVTFERENKNQFKNNFYYDIALKYFLPVESLPPRDEGITLTRELFALGESSDGGAVTKATVGEVIRGKLTLTIPATYHHVAIEDVVPAGFEIVNFNLATEDQTLTEETESDQYEDGYDYGYEEGYYDPFEAQSGTRDENMIASAWGAIQSTFGKSQAAFTSGFNELGGSARAKTKARTLRPTHTESHDDRLFLYTEYLAPGVYEYEYFLRALVPGTFQHLPARAEELYFPEVFGRTSGDIITITPAK